MDASAPEFLRGIDRALTIMAALSHMAPMIIAIDGPAASGKGTLGKRLAHHYGYRHLDTGVIYRAVAKALLDAGFDLTDEPLAVAAAMELDPEKFGHPELKTQRIGDAASVVSAIPGVREALVSFQRQFAADPPGAVLDGRDIGTVICPHADVKILSWPTRRCGLGGGRWKRGRAAKRPTRRWCSPTSSSAMSATGTAPPPP